MQIKITLKNNKPFYTGFNYNYKLQSAIFYKLKEIGTSDFWHDEGFGDAVRFKGFVFGSLKGEYSIKNKMMCFEKNISFELRSPVFEFCDEFQRSIELNPYFRLSNSVFEIDDVIFSNRHINTSEAVFETESPVTVYDTVKDRSLTVYYKPEEPEFIMGLKSNFRKKYMAIYKKEPPEIEILTVGNYKKTVTKYKETWINAYNGKIIVRGNPNSLEFVYNSGLGSKNSQGFGMVNIK